MSKEQKKKSANSFFLLILTRGEDTGDLNE
jgi:hypothetical protein